MFLLNESIEKDKENGGRKSPASSGSVFVCVCLCVSGVLICFTYRQDIVNIASSGCKHRIFR